MSSEFTRIHPSAIAKHVGREVTLVGHLKGGVLEMPDNKSVTLKNFGGEASSDRIVEVRGSLLDTMSIRCDSHTDFGRDFGKR